MGRRRRLICGKVFNHFVASIRRQLIFQRHIETFKVTLSQTPEKSTKKKSFSTKWTNDQRATEIREEKKSVWKKASAKSSSKAP